MKINPGIKPNFSAQTNNNKELVAADKNVKINKAVKVENKPVQKETTQYSKDEFLKRYKEGELKDGDYYKTDDGKYAVYYFVDLKDGDYREGVRLTEYEPS